MGTSKLLLPWPSESIRDAKIIDHLLRAWTSSNVSETVVVVRKDDAMLKTACKRWPVSVCEADSPPADMKGSIQLGLCFLQSKHRPASSDWCFVAPADLPTLRQNVINRMIDTIGDNSTTIHVATYGGKQSHPILLPWSTTSDIFHLADNEGIDVLVDRYCKFCVDFPAKEKSFDIDTPDDYQQAIKLRNRQADQ